MPSVNQSLSWLRHAATFVAGAATPLAIMGLSPDQANEIVAGATQLLNGLQDVIGGASRLAIVAGPIVAGVMAWWARRSASPANQALSVAAQGAKVVVPTDAPQELKDLAKSSDPKAANIVEAK